MKTRKYRGERKRRCVAKIRRSEIYKIFERDLLFVLYIIGLPSGMRSYTAYMGSARGTTVSPVLYFIAQFMGTFQYFVKLFIVTLIAFFIFNNFKIVYGAVKKLLR